MFRQISSRIRLPRNSRDLLHAANLRHGADGFTSPLKEGVLRIFFALKNPTASTGFEPANLGTKGQHATSRPPKPIARNTDKNLHFRTYSKITTLNEKAEVLGNAVEESCLLGCDITRMCAATAIKQYRGIYLEAQREILCCRGGGSRYLQNVGTYLQNYAVSHPRQ